MRTFITAYVPGYLDLVEEEGYLKDEGKGRVSIGFKLSQGNLDAILILY